MMTRCLIGVTVAWSAPDASMVVTAPIKEAMRIIAAIIDDVKRYDNSVIASYR